MVGLANKLNTNGIYLATASTQHEPDPELVKDGRLHPSRIRQVGVSTGLMTMDKEQNPRLSVVGCVTLILIATALYMTYQFGQSQGRYDGYTEGYDKGTATIESRVEAERQKAILDAMQKLEVKKSYQMGVNDGK